MNKSPLPDGISISSISRYRREIMGAAILGIMLYHGRAVLHGGIGGYLFASLKLMMQMGVDVFLLLSGFGCFHSLRKGSSSQAPLCASCSFYGKRLRRILPKYLLVIALDCVLSLILLKKIIWPAVFESYSLITFFTSGVLYEWFIASILALYLITPLLFLLVNANQKVFCCLIGFAATGAVCISLCNGPSTLMIVNEIFFTRIPVYMAGLLLGKKYAEGAPTVRRKTVLLICAAAFAALITNRLFNSVNEDAVERLLFCPLAIALCFLLASVFESHPGTGQKVFSFFGGITLELYLVHEKLIRIIHRTLFPESWNFGQMVLVDTLSFLAAVGLALLIHRLFLPLEKRRS